MAAYNKALGSGGKTLVLPPDKSDFFKFFDSPAGSAPNSTTPALANPTVPAN